MPPLATPAWLADHLPTVHVLDATLLDPALGRDARAEFAAGHIPGAAFLDLATLRDTADPLPNALPDAATVAARLGALGVAQGDAVVLYDDSPWHSAARAWWLLRLYGMREVAILDGGLARWRAEGRPLDTGAPSPAPHPTTLPPRAPGTRTLAEVAKATRTGTAQIVDARSPARFTGAEAERPGVAPGHIPGSASLHYARLFHPDGTWTQGDDLRAAFAAANVDPDRPVIATCGSGVTAATVVFALHLLGRDASLYDGSWSEWGADPDTPKAPGPSRHPGLDPG